MPFLIKRNIYLFFIRGNHDNPNYFNGWNREAIVTDRFIPIPDYTMITVNDKKILCIGGATSVDRITRVDEKSCWEGEEIQPIYGIEDTLPKECDILITHTVCRDYIAHHLPKSKMLEMFLQQDATLQSDLNQESMICESIYKHYYPKIWLHGHFHKSAVTQLYDTKIISLGSNELIELKI
jgi:predicted phosphodiesterase